MSGINWTSDNLKPVANPEDVYAAVNWFAAYGDACERIGHGRLAEKIAETEREAGRLRAAKYRVMADLHRAGASIEAISQAFDLPIEAAKRVLRTGGDW